MKYVIFNLPNIPNQITLTYSQSDQEAILELLKTLRATIYKIDYKD